MKKTTNYKMNLPEESDIIDINVLNTNFSTIDTEIKKHADQLKAVTLAQTFDVISVYGKTAFYHGTVQEGMPLLQEVETSFGYATFGKGYGTFSAQVGSKISLYVVIRAENGTIYWDEYYNDNPENGVLVGTATVIVHNVADTQATFEYYNDDIQKTDMTLRQAITELAMQIQILNGR